MLVTCTSNSVAMKVLTDIGLVQAAEDVVDLPEVPAKPRSEVIIYTADFLQGFQEVG